MLENINLKDFPKESGVYWILDENNVVVYVGSSKNLYNRMIQHRFHIKECGRKKGSQSELYQFLKNNPLKVEFQIVEDYRQKEQELIEKHNPKYNNLRAYTGVAWDGKKAEYMKEYYKEFKEERNQYQKQYYDSYKEEIKQYEKKYRKLHKEEIKQYRTQQCLYNGETLNLDALKKRFWRKGISNPTAEAKKYLI